MKLVELKIKGISYNETQSGAYALILNEANGNRNLPIIIGGYEAQSIAISLEKEVKPLRPLTHELFKNFAETFNVEIKKIIIHKLIDGIFFSSLICERNKIEQVIDARTSDAIAIALKFKAPIFIYESIMKSAGFTANLKTETKKHVLDDSWIEKISEAPSEEDLPENIESFSKSKLKLLLKKLVLKEDYEKAAKVRDLISKKII